MSPSPYHRTATAVLYREHLRLWRLLQPVDESNNGGEARGNEIRKEMAKVETTLKERGVPIPTHHSSDLNGEEWS